MSNPNFFYCSGCKEKKWKPTAREVDGKLRCTRCCADLPDDPEEDAKFERIWREKGFDTSDEPPHRRFNQYFLGEETEVGEVG